MHFYKNITRLILPGMLLFSFASCKKDQAYKQTTDSKDNAVVYIQQAITYPQALTIFPLADTARTLSINASFGAVGLPQDNIDITFAANNKALDSINTIRVNAGLSPYEKFPADAYTVDSWNASIQGGTLSSNLVNIKYYSKKFDPRKSYLLPISIQDASGYMVNSDLKTVYLVVAKVEFNAGAYASNGVRNNYAANGTFASASNYSTDKTLTQYVDPLDPASVQFDIDKVANLGANQIAGTIFRVKVNADLSVTVYGQLGPGAPIVNMAGLQNDYNPATKTFTLNYKYTNTNGTYRVMTETLAKK